MATTVRTISAITSPQYGEAVGLYRETSAPSRAFCGMNSLFLSVFHFSPLVFSTAKLPARAASPTTRESGNPRVQGDHNYYALWDDLGRMVPDAESAAQLIATVLLERRVCQCKLPGECCFSDFLLAPVAVWRKPLGRVCKGQCTTRRAGSCRGPRSRFAMWKRAGCGR